MRKRESEKEIDKLQERMVWQSEKRNFLMCSRKLVLPLLMAHLKNEKSTRPTMATTTEIIKIPTTTYANRKNGIPNNNGKLDISCSENGEN